MARGLIVTRDRRQGRGRLSSLEMLPEEADEALAWVNAELAEMKIPQTQILAEFNDRLAGIGVSPVSKGAFSRYSVRKAKANRAYAERMRMDADLYDRLGADGAERATVTLSERLKVAIAEVVEKGNLSPKELNALANASRATVTAQRHALELRQKLEAELSAKVAEAQKDLGAIGKAHGISAEAMAKINQRLAGIA